MVSLSFCGQIMIREEKAIVKHTRHTSLILLIVAANLAGLSAIGKFGTHDFEDTEVKHKVKASEVAWTKAMSSYRAAYQEQHLSGPAFTKLQTNTPILFNTQIPNNIFQYASSSA